MSVEVGVQPSITIVGPTASGKTALAIELARELNGEILSVDSRQVFRGMDIGTGKDLDSYGEIPLHLVDLCNPGQPFSLFDFIRQAKQALDEVQARGRQAIFAGGTGLYLDALLKGYELHHAPPDPALRARYQSWTQEELVAELQSRKTLHNTTDSEERERTLRALEIDEAERRGQSERIRLAVQGPVLGLTLPPELLRERIRLRLKRRLEEGMIEEVVQLREQGVASEWLESVGLEYRFINRFLSGDLNRNDMFQKLLSEIVRFSRQQRKWFRRLERQGVSIIWVDASQTGEAQLADALTALSESGLELQSNGLHFRPSEGGDDDTQGISFDRLKKRFQENIYNSQKGQIRLDLLREDLAGDWVQERVSDTGSLLDLGCGAAPLSLDWARRGYQVTLADISEDMLAQATGCFEAAAIPAAQYRVLHGPLQQVTETLNEGFDVILLHAVLEWLPDPQAGLRAAVNLLRPGGVLSLTFYNLNSFIYRRLLQGNFRQLDFPRPRPHLGDLTPIYPLKPEEIRQWLSEWGLETGPQRGLRCFADYMHPQAASNDYADILAQERRYGVELPYRELARYIHILARRPSDANEPD